MAFLPSIQQQAIFDFVQNGTGNLIIDAKAGAGKSTTLVNAAALMSGFVCIAVYNTKMGKELKEKLAKLPDMGKVSAMTFHAVGRNALIKAGIITDKTNPDDKKVEKMIAEYIALKGRLDLEPYTKAVAAMVSMAKQRGIGIPGLFEDRMDVWEDMVWHFGLEEHLPEGSDQRDDEQILGKAIAFAAFMLKASNKRAKETGSIDFDDMIYLTLLFNVRVFQLDWLLVDEAQDTNPTRRALAKKMLRQTGRFIAVGDPNQAIYGFSGADNDALDQIANDFRCATLGLSVTYRCPKSVVAMAQRWVPEIEAHHTAPQGVTRSIPFDTLLDEVRAGDMVLCRYTKYLVTAAFKLIRAGRAAKIEGRAIGAGLVALANKWKSSDLDELAEYVNKWMDKEEAKALDAGKESKADAIRDRGETLLVLIEGALAKGINTVPGLKAMVTEMFDDRILNPSSIVTLCSVHRAKGLENPRVFVLGLNELMGKECAQPWQSQQEQNLCYVAVTRAQEELIDVFGVKEEKRIREAA